MGMRKGENVNERRNGSRKDNGKGIGTATRKGAQITVRMAVDREERAEITKRNEDEKECEWGGGEDKKQEYEKDEEDVDEQRKPE